MGASFCPWVSRERDEDLAPMEGRVVGDHGCGGGFGDVLPGLRGLESGTLGGAKVLHTLIREPGR